MTALEGSSLKNTRTIKNINKGGKTMPTKGEHTSFEQWLNDYELSIISNTQNDKLFKSIKQRGEIFAALNDEWFEYNPRTSETRLLEQGEWESNIRIMLMVDFGLDEETSNRMIGQYFMKLREGGDK